jgi:hypothetical protein
MPPLQTEHLLRAQTLEEGRVSRPFHVGLRNTLVALAAIAVGGLGYLIKFSPLNEPPAWRAWAAVAAGVAVTCFGHAYLGARIGGRRANNIAVLVLVGCLFALVLWMQHANDAGR